MEQFDNWEQFDNYKEYQAIVDFAHYVELNTSIRGQANKKQLSLSYILTESYP